MGLVLQAVVEPARGIDRGLVLAAIRGDLDGVERQLAVSWIELHSVAGPLGEDFSRLGALAATLDAEGVQVPGEGWC